MAGSKSTAIVEQAAIRLYRARVAKRKAYVALKAYRKEHGSCVEHGNYPPCYSTDIAEIDEWCKTCKGSQPLWEARRKAGVEAGAALVSLLNIVKTQHYDQL